MKIKITLCLVLIGALAVSACGRKGSTEWLPDSKRPKFDRVIDEEN